MINARWSRYSDEYLAQRRLLFADNFTTNPGSGGSTFASDDVGGIQHTRVKSGWGADGVYNDPSDAAPFPAKLAALAAGGGLSAPFRSLDVDETEEEISATACSIYGWFIYNMSAAKRYVKFYNLTAANTTVGSSTPLITLVFDAGTGANVSFPHGIPFSTACCIAATTGIADADTGAPSGNDVLANVWFKN